MEPLNHEKKELQNIAGKGKYTQRKNKCTVSDTDVVSVENGFIYAGSSTLFWSCGRNDYESIK
jgi:hypothetical protein